MTSKKQKDSSVEIEDAEVVEAATAVSFELPQKKISFDQFVTLHKIKPHHTSGFKAHVQDVDYPRTYEEWVAILKTY